MSSTIYRDVPYYHNETTVTLYDVQEVRQEGSPPMYAISESDKNIGPGFDNGPTRDAVAKDMAHVIKEADGCSPEQVNLYQQRPDGDFDQVDFREIGRDGQSQANQEQQQSDPELYPANQETTQTEQAPQWTEYNRTPNTRADVERSLGEMLEAPEQSPQQRQEAPAEQLRDVSGPTIDRAHEQSQPHNQQSQEF